MKRVAVAAIVWILVVPGEDWSWMIIAGPWDSPEPCAHARLEHDDTLGYPSGLCVDLRRAEPKAPLEPPAIPGDADQASSRSW